MAIIHRPVNHPIKQLSIPFRYDSLFRDTPRDAVSLRKAEL